MLALHLSRGPYETPDKKLEIFYDNILSILRQETLRNGQWHILDCASAWEGNWTQDCFLVFTWSYLEQLVLVAVDYAPNQSQSLVRLPFEHLANNKWSLMDQFSSASYDWNGNDLISGGLFLDIEPWKYSVLTFCPVVSEIIQNN